jgi:small subunit ribosomal protein S6
MRPYEVMLILDSTVEEGVVDGAVTRLKELVDARSGKTGQVAKWVRRRFAYEMKHRNEGYYALVEITVDPAAVADLDRALTLSDDIVRHKIVRVPEVIAGRTSPASNSEPSENAGESTGENS